MYYTKSGIIINERYRKVFENNTSSFLAYTDLIPQFLNYMLIEKGRAKSSLKKYDEVLRWIPRYFPHLTYATDINQKLVIELKSQLVKKGCSGNRINSFVFTLRNFLNYCNQIHKIEVMNINDITPMKIKDKEVIYLTKVEIAQLMESINVKDRRGVRMRALMEFLLGTGLRISECLILNRKDIDWNENKTSVIGKGNKQRTIFITERAKYWMNEYFKIRQDDNEALFVTHGVAKRLKQYDLSKLFKICVEKSGLNKKVTPHILRHTAATIMHINGCQLAYLQKILGHSDIKTTLKYYVGIDQSSLKEAHKKYLNF